MTDPHQPQPLDEYLKTCSDREYAEYIIATMTRGDSPLEFDKIQKDAIQEIRSRPAPATPPAPAAEDNGVFSLGTPTPCKVFTVEQLQEHDRKAREQEREVIHDDILDYANGTKTNPIYGLAASEILAHIKQREALRSQQQGGGPFPMQEPTIPGLWIDKSIEKELGTGKWELEGHTDHTVLTEAASTPTPAPRDPPMKGAAYPEKCEGAKGCASTTAPASSIFNDEVLQHSASVFEHLTQPERARCPYSSDDDMCLECKAHEERITRKARIDEYNRLKGIAKSKDQRCDDDWFVAWFGESLQSQQQGGDPQ